MNNLLLKKDLTVEQLTLVQSEMNLKQKQAVIAYLLWFFLGILGAHRFYTKNIVMAIFMILTLGGLGIWTLIDVFFINGRINVLNQEIEAEIIQNVKANTNYL